MNWLSQFFLNPGLIIPGIALASLPVIIHILSRLRYRTVRFAAMEFLLRSDELNRRRLILEQLLLLLLRVLAVILITLLIGRLVLDPARLLMLRGSSVHHVMILDDTLSLREQRGDQSVFTMAVSTLENMLSDAESQRSGARVSILTVSSPDRPVISDRPLNQLLIQEVNLRLRTLKATYRSASPTAALMAARTILAADGGIAPQVHVITDFRRTDWQNNPEVISALESLKSINSKVQVVRLVADPGNNIAITSLTGSTTAIARGIPWRIHVEARNYGAAPVQGLRAKILLDGAPMPSTILFPDLDASKEVTVSHDITFQDTGTHRIEVQLDDDVLLPDNSRFLTIDVTEKRQILLVDDDPQQEDAGFVSSAISADSDLTGIAADVRSSQALNSLNLAAYDVIYMMNVRDLPADSVVQLAGYVRDGGGVAWFPGEQVSAEWYRSLYQNAQQRLFPVPLGSVTSAGSRIPDVIAADDGAESGYQIPVFSNHPVFSVYNTPDSPFAEAVHISKWLSVDDSWQVQDSERQDGVTTLARLRNGAPVIFEHSLGEGRILTFLTGAGKRWSNWPVAPAAWGYVVVHLSMHPYLQRRTSTSQMQEIAESLTMTWPAAQYSGNVEVYLPEPDINDDMAATTFLRLQSEELSAPNKNMEAPSAEDITEGASAANRDENAAEDSKSTSTSAQISEFQINLRQADRPGIYRIRRFTTVDGQPDDTWIAMNVPVSESDLAAAESEQLTTRASLSHVQIQDSGSATSLGSSAGGRELRWMILLSLVLILMAEQLLSLRMSHHPEVRA